MYEYPLAEHGSIEIMFEGQKEKNQYHPDSHGRGCREIEAWRDAGDSFV